MGDALARLRGEVKTLTGWHKNCTVPLVGRSVPCDIARLATIAAAALRVAEAAIRVTDEHGSVDCRCPAHRALNAALTALAREERE